ALIRRQAASDRDGVFNLRHQSIAVDALDRALLAQLDGTRDRKALIVLVGAALERGDFEVKYNDAPVTPEALADVVDSKLAHLARVAFLTA
ncbi:MAG: methyltransferase-like protein, partial [Bradymonadia bacterium]